MTPQQLQQLAMLQQQQRMQQQQQQQQQQAPRADPVMQQIIDADFKPVPLKLGEPNNSSVSCSTHGLEVCPDCKLDFSQLNLLTKALANRPDIAFPPPPQPQFVHPARSVAVTKTKDEGNVCYFRHAHITLTWHCLVEPFQGGSFPSGRADVYYGCKHCRVARTLGAVRHHARGTCTRAMQSFRCPSLQWRGRTSSTRREPSCSIQDTLGQGPFPPREGIGCTRPPAGGTLRYCQCAPVRAAEPGM